MRGRRTISTPKGFVFMCFEQRPSGIYAIFYLITLQGSCSRFGQIPLSYSLDSGIRNALSLFEIRYYRGFLELYVLGRNAPRLHVHQQKFTGEFNHYSYNLPTALGLIGGEHVHTITKGGSVCRLSVEGPGMILQTPKGFPGRYFKTTTHDKMLFASWLAMGEQGLPPQKGVFAGDFRDNGDVMRFHSKETLQSCDIIHDGKDLWLVYSRAEDFQFMEIWVTQATGIIQYQLPSELIHDEIDLFFLVQDENQAVLVINLIDGTLQLFALGGEEPISLGTVRQ